MTDTGEAAPHSRPLRLSFTTHPSSSTPVDGSANQIFTLNLTSRRDKFLSGRL